MCKVVIIAALTASLLGLAPRKPVEVGQTAPPVVALTAGGDHDIEGYYHHRYVLLTFWSMEGRAGLRQLPDRIHCCGFDLDHVQSFNSGHSNRLTVTTA